MALANYTDLQTAIGRWTKRPNVMVSATTADLIALFEASANATLRVRENEIDLARTATIGSPLISLPSNFQEAVSLKVTADQRKLIYTAPDALPYLPQSGPSDRWTITESSIKTERDADQAYAYTLRYHKKYALATDTTNALLTRYPNVYLYGSLLEAGPYLRDLSILAVWGTAYGRAKTELDRAEGRYKSRGTLSVDPALVSVGSFNMTTGA